MSTTQNIARSNATNPKPKPAVRTLLTRGGAEALTAELARLRHELDVEFAARLGETRGLGELNNNDDYLQIKEEEAVVEARFRQLEAVLGAAQIVDETAEADDIVAIGSLVEVQDLTSGIVREHELAGGFESCGRGHVSANSPVGRALLARRPGDEVTIELPTGRSLRLRVLAVNRRGRTWRGVLPCPPALLHCRTPSETKSPKRPAACSSGLDSNRFASTDSWPRARAPTTARS